MFILTRSIGESVLIGDQITLTVAVLSDEVADVGLFQDGVCIGRAALQWNRRHEVASGVTAIYIERLGEQSARFGFESSAGVSVSRI